MTFTLQDIANELIQLKGAEAGEFAVQRLQATDKTPAAVLQWIENVSASLKSALDGMKEYGVSDDAIATWREGFFSITNPLVEQYTSSHAS